MEGAGREADHDDGQYGEERPGECTAADADEVGLERRPEGVAHAFSERVARGAGAVRRRNWVVRRPEQAGEEARAGREAEEGVGGFVGERRSAACHRGIVVAVALSGQSSKRTSDLLEAAVHSACHWCGGDVASRDECVEAGA